MKMLSATTIAALALGLALTGPAAQAADYPGRGNQDATTNTQQNDQNDKHDRDRKGGKKPAKVETGPAQTGPAGHPNRRVGNDNRRNDSKFNNGNRRQIDLKRWQRNMNAPRRYRITTYHGPRDYQYRRWSYGQRLPRVYYARNYWLMDFIRFGLLSPPDGYVWVRYGPDALLIDEETGEIVQVQYNVFYS